MIKQLKDPVTYSTLNDSDYFKIASNSNVLLAIYVAFSGIALIVLAGYIVIKLYEKTHLKKTIKILGFPIFIVLAFTFIVINYHVTKFITIESKLLISKPYYRSVNITGKIDDITNGSNEHHQEIRFSKNGKNYYVTIPSNIAARPNDKINVKINKQVIDNSSVKNNFNDDLTHNKDTISISHDNKTYHTHLY